MRRPLFLTFLFVSVLVSGRGQDSASSPQPAKNDPKQVQAPVPIESPEAQVPEEAQRRHLTGVCVVSLIVDANGQPQNPHIVRCTDPMFVDSSLAAIRKYRFKPARRLDGTPVPVMVSIDITYKLKTNDRALGSEEPSTRVRYDFSTPAGITSAEPDGIGVYPFTKAFDPPNSPPRMVEFVSKGFGRAALPFPDGVACDVLLTIDAKGKPSGARISRCDNPVLEKPAVDSLLKSKYKAGLLNGKAVAVRVNVRLAYEGFSTQTN